MVTYKIWSTESNTYLVSANTAPVVRLARLIQNLVAMADRHTYKWQHQAFTTKWKMASLSSRDACRVSLLGTQASSITMYLLLPGNKSANAISQARSTLTIWCITAFATKVDHNDPSDWFDWQYYCSISTLIRTMLKSNVMEVPDRFLLWFLAWIIFTSKWGLIKINVTLMNIRLTLIVIDPPKTTSSIQMKIKSPSN